MSSVPTEQVFSVAGEVTNNKQPSLKPKNVDVYSCYLLGLLSNTEDNIRFSPTSVGFYK